MAISTEITFRDFDHYMKVVHFLCNELGDNWGFSSMVLNNLDAGSATTDIIADDDDAEMCLMHVMLM